MEKSGIKSKRTKNIKSLPGILHEQSMEILEWTKKELKL
jgi:hypothetical protein